MGGEDLRLKGILERLEEFDKAHGWDDYNQVLDRGERLQKLQNQTLNLLGELGEFANELKKSKRDNTFDHDHLKEEAVDMLIFLLKITRHLDMDVEQEFHRKMDRNEERFSHLVQKEKKEKIRAD